VPVTVEADIANGLPGFTIVGLTDRAIQEARERVKPAIRNAGFKFPPRRVTVNLAPAELPKEGTGFDLAIATAILRAEDPSLRLEGLAFLGELALDASLRPVTGVLPMARCLAAAGIRRLVVPVENASEAALAEGIEVLGAATLRSCVEYLRGEGSLIPGVRDATPAGGGPEPDMAAVRGQGQAKRALEIAAAGGHNVLMTGPPGAGKTMLARTFPSLLPDLASDAALEVAAIYSLRGTLRERPPTTLRPPFRAPHHSISRAGLVGGGTGLAQPGEISLAHARVTLCAMTTTLAPPSTVQAAVYVRISSDPDGTRLGVSRQEQDCRELAARRGWEVAGIYEDDDISAYSGKTRPAYRRLLDDIRAGAVQAVVAWHPDRLHRAPRELEEFIDVLEATGCRVETVKAGELDLSSPSGRAVARTLGAWARYESEHKSDRLKRKHLQIAEDGQDAGGGRPFGYEPDRRTIRLAEAVLVRDAAERVLAGGSLRGLCRDWDTRGIPTVTGARWSAPVMRRMLLSARISGRRERRTIDGHRREMGTIVATAVWPAIISVEQSDRLRRLLGNGERRMNGTATKYLLSGGTAVCGLCGAALVARPRAATPSAAHPEHRPSAPSLVCASGPGFKGCGGIRIEAEPLDALVTEAVLQAVDGGALLEVMARTDDAEAVEGLLAVEGKLANLAADWASDRISRGEWDAARATLLSREQSLRRRVEASRRGHDLDGLPDPLRTAWPALPLHRRRAIIGALVEAVVVGPGVRGRNRFDPERVSIRWKV
jgi:DNA invertase Pin-like site-specific DNA recombinase